MELMEALAAAVRADEDDAAAVLAAADAALAAEAGDEQQRAAQHGAKCAALAKLGRHADALAACEAAAAAGCGAAVRFEHAYALYQLKRHADALELLSEAGDDEPRLRHLRAQVLYREDRFAEAAALLDAFGDSDGSVAPAELAVNRTAALVNASSSSAAASSSGAAAAADQKALRARLAAVLTQAARAGHAASGSFELVYNEACAAIEEQAWSRAATRLADAAELCRSSLAEEGLAEDEIADELAVITCQQAFVRQQQGDDARARELYESVVAQKPSDVTVTAVASNNLIAIHRDHDLFDSFKRIRAATSDVMEQKLTTRQRSVIGFNHSLLLMHMNKGEDCRQLIQTLREERPELARSGRLTLVEASLLRKEKRGEEADRLLTEFAATGGASSVASSASAGSAAAAATTTTTTTTTADADVVNLARAQSALALGDVEGTVTILEAAYEARPTPGVAATLAVLYSRQEQPLKAQRIIDAHVAAVEERVQRREVEAAVLLDALRRAADFYEAHGQPRAAARVLERIVSLAPGDQDAVPRLVLALAQTDYRTAESYEAMLPPVGDDDFLSDEAIDRLEAAGTATSTPSSTTTSGGKAELPDETAGAGAAAAAAAAKAAAASAAAAEGAAAAGSRTTARRVRKRKPRFPKGYTAETIKDAPPADPERWIPKRERAAAKKKRRGNARRSAAAAGAQASAAKGAQGSQDKDHTGGIATPEQIARQAEARAAKHEADLQRQAAERAAAGPISAAAASGTPPKPKGGGGGGAGKKKGRRRR